eukprot:10575393-Alexandrium_andersonii.AAC.1
MLQGLFQALQDYFLGTEWKLGGPSTSWLELLADFAVVRGKQQLLREACPVSDLQLLVSHLVKAFRDAALSYLEAHVHAEHVSFFSPGVRAPTLKRIGFCSSLQAVQAVPKWDEARRSSVDRVLIALRPGLTTAAKVQDAISGVLRLQMVALRLKVRPPWNLQSQRGESSEGPRFEFFCPGKCGTKFAAQVKPAPIDTAWPFWACFVCQRKLRIGNATCATCLCALRVCKCNPALGESAPRQTTLLSFFAKR